MLFTGRAKLLRKTLLIPALALLGTTASGVPLGVDKAQAATLSDFEGRFRYTGGAADRADLDAAVENVVESLNFADGTAPTRRG